MKYLLLSFLFFPTLSIAGECSVTMVCPNGQQISCRAWNGISSCERVRENGTYGVVCSAGFSYVERWCKADSQPRNSRKDRRR